MSTTYNEAAAMRFMARGELVDRLTTFIAEESGWDDPDDVAQAREQAENVIDFLIADGSLFASERWDEECHDCEKRIGDHPADGRCP